MSHRITCGHCSQVHATIEGVKACHGGAHIGTCGWLVERSGRWVEHDDDPGDGVYVEGGPSECGAEAMFDERGWRCVAGHEHVSMEARHAEGWDYAEDFGEAMNLARAGVEPLTMSGHVVLGPQSFAPHYA